MTIIGVVEAVVVTCFTDKQTELPATSEQTSLRETELKKQLNDEFYRRLKFGMFYLNRRSLQCTTEERKWVKCTLFIDEYVAFVRFQQSYCVYRTALSFFLVQ